MPDFHVIKGEASVSGKRKSVAGSKRVTEEQKRVANEAQGVVAPKDQEALLDSTLDASDYKEPGEPIEDVDIEEASSSHVSAKTGKKRSSIVIGVVAALVAILLGLAAAFCCYRWAYGNDVQDIQGVWYVNGSNATMTITDKEIVLTDEVSYAYTIDPFTKTIRYSFSDLSGSGSYRFSLDREELVIIDGEKTASQTLIADFTWLIGALIDAAQGYEASPVSKSESQGGNSAAENTAGLNGKGLGLTLLSRMSTVVMPEGSLAFGGDSTETTHSAPVEG